MPRYRAEIHGGNFLVQDGDQVFKREFITYRVVDAPDSAAAEDHAVQSVRETPHLREIVRNDPADPSTMKVIELVVLEDDAPGEDLPTGFIWYEDPPKRWWQFWR